jgi:diketogulonate reductase-like aldo/keto reductase
VTVLVKSSHPDRIAVNIDVAGFSLSPDEVTAINGLSRR